MFVVVVSIEDQLLVHLTLIFGIFLVPIVFYCK